MLFKNRVYSCSYLVGLMLGALPALAQQAPDAGGAGVESAATGTLQLQEVVVTAQKVATPAEKTPISMEVYSAQDVLKEGITNLQDLATLDTSLQFNTDGGSGWLTIRGVSSHDDTEIGSPAVPVVVDNFTSDRSWSVNNTMFDIERIEVLRGPQGTLFGRSSTGGLLNIVPNKPGKQFVAGGSIAYGNYAALNTLGVLNMPLSDTVQLRLSLSTDYHEGYHGRLQTNDFTAPASERADDQNAHMGRFQIAFEPWDHFYGRLSFEFMQINDIGNAQHVIPFNFLPLPGGQPCNFIINAGGNSPACSADDISHNKPALGNPADFPMYGRTYTNVNSKWLRGEFSYDALPGGLTLTYLGGYALQEFRHLNPGGTGNPQFSSSPDGFFPTRQFNMDEEPHTQNHELRLTSAPGQRLSWQTGLYYFWEDNNLHDFGSVDPSGSDPNTLVNLNAFLSGAGLPTLPSTQYLNFIFPSVLQTDKALYAQGSYKITDTGTLSAGVRYSRDDVVRTGVFNLLWLGFVIPQGGSASSDKMTYHLGYDWNPTDHNLVYAKADTGYKPGGFDTCSQYNPENVTTGELGTKNRMLNGRLQFDIAGYYTAYRDQQVTQFTNSCISGTHTTNAGSSNIYGLETNLTALAGPVGRFDFGLSLLHARFGTFLTPPVIGNPALVDCRKTVVTAQGTNCDLSGNYLSQSPDVTLSAAFEHEWNLAEQGTLDFRVEGKFTSKSYFDVFNYQDTEQPAYGVGNAYLDWAKGDWTISIYCRNFTNTVYFSNAFENSGNGTNEYDYEYNAPRTFGARVQMFLTK